MFYWICSDTLQYLETINCVQTNELWWREELMLDIANKTAGEEARRQLYKNVASNIE